LLLMIGIYVGTKLGGSFAAILLRTPGTPAAACTALDGYPMAQQGKAGLALGYATMASTFGGLVSWILAVNFVPLISSIAVKSSNADIALIGIAGLIMVSAFVRGSMVRGLIGVTLGMLIGTVGLDPQDAVERYTFGNVYLMSGIPFAAVLIGLFGFTVVLSDLKLIGSREHLIASEINFALPGLRDLLSRWKAIAIGSLSGTAVGAVPGVGSEGSTWLAYAMTRNRSPHPEKFGTGVPEGILAPESSNNATTGGTMIPMLTLGIPGDGSTAVMLGALMLHGIEPGIMLMKESADVVYGILAGLLVATIVMFVIAWTAIRYFILILQRDRSWLFPFVLVFATVGSFAITNTFFPVYIAIGFGILGYILEQRNFPVVTIVLGVILGPIIEVNFRLALALSNNDYTTFVATWPRQLIVAVVILLFAREVYGGVKRLLEGRGTAGLAARPLSSTIDSEERKR
ncbi:MAG: tripartite tricarboxylate transporter permease, partial [Alphaproteobacteria bacterium]